MRSRNAQVVSPDARRMPARRALGAMKHAMFTAGVAFCSRQDWHNVYRQYCGGTTRLENGRQKLGWLVLCMVGVVYDVQRIRDRYLLAEITGKVTGGGGLASYDAHVLHLTTNRIYDLPAVAVDERAPKRVNVLVPAFDYQSISAGFFGVFQIARFVARCGYLTRLVLFDNFVFDLDDFRRRLKEYPEHETLADEVEIEYIGDRRAPLAVSRADNCVATVWYSAFYAQKVMELIGGGRFLYLIQDYEAAFYPSGALSALAERSYGLSYNALISSASLARFMTSRGIGSFAEGAMRYEYFNNACSSRLPYLRRPTKLMSKAKRRFVFYSRPAVPRNMFELGALVIAKAVERGIFEPDRWEFIGIGLGNVEIRISSEVVLRQMQRMTLGEYQRMVGSFDVGLSLMASPHPSLVPFDLAASGVVVVTNSFATKDKAYFSGVSANIIVAEPHLDPLVDAVASAVERAADIRGRYRAAESTVYPRSWREVFSHEHVALLRETFGSA